MSDQKKPEEGQKQEKQGKKNAGDKLQDLLGFDAAKRNNLPSDAFAKVVKEIKKERTKEARAKAKEHLIKAMALREQMEKARRDFESQYKKFEKELGKVLNQIQGMLAGKSPEEIEEENKDKDRQPEPEAA